MVLVRVQTDYCLCIEGLSIFFTNYPDFYKHATVLISQEQQDDPEMCFYPEDICGLRYSGLDFSYFLVFLEKKDNGTVASYSNDSKFCDVIKYGSKIAGAICF